ncbi:response regulator [Legionella israelensis]|uniref:Response regulator n=1 Tax=Legionella israelensis TaxID=454 RepID=A0A0W0V2B1_9GAMM|nr:response regulator [Legionella israelensis]KTD14248.1 Two component response regulator [Legionella israelensis]QBR85037.1 response regulator [Legionella israelensis]QBS10071.1 response regulator [Legionella israelensis]QDP71117.1 response regulator [Legionella israelensis]SCX97504.1 Response regulator receiver domain-containing protein [Legionella israelensis DSM 19235]
MQHFSIPTCFFPSTTLFIDDCRDFLLNFVLQLDEGLAYRVFDSPFDALKFIEKTQSELDLLNQHCLKEQIEAKHFPSTHQTINLDLAAIRSEVYNPNRFSEISVVVIDYVMPGINGLDFCRKLAHTNIKKILLTGQADEKLAIEAFHEGLIDRYIKKSDANAADLITKSIYELQLQYFQSMSDMFVKMLSVSSPSCLQDKTFIDFFQTICAENKVVEYYMVDNSGSFLFLDDDANASFLMVKNAKDMKSYYDFALDNGAGADILQQIGSGEKIPYFGDASMNIPQNIQWSSYLVPAKELVANEIYFYSYMRDSLPFDICQDKIRSYYHYLEELDAEELLMM